MKMRILLALVVSLGIFGAFYASAANLGVDGGVLQAGVDTDLVCDSDGVQVVNWVYESTGQLVYSFKIDGIDAACAGSEIVVGLHGAAGNQLRAYTGVVPTGGGLMTFSTSPNQVPAADIFQVSVALATSQ